VVGRVLISCGGITFLYLYIYLKNFIPLQYFVLTHLYASGTRQVGPVFQIYPVQLLDRAPAT